MSDLLAVISLALASCFAVGLLGTALLYLVRRRSLRYQLTIAILLPVLAVVATVMINVRLMFASGHDSAVILIALATALILAVLGAWLVTRRIVRASREVGVGLDQLVADTSEGMPNPLPSGQSNTAGAPQELAKVLDDLSDTRRTLAESRARERAAEQSRRQLVTFMSHDLRTPLAALTALAEGLEDGVIADVPRALSQVRSTVSRMSVLVDDLFALSRVQGPDASKPSMPVSVTELVSDIVSEAAASAAANGVQLSTDLPDDDRLAVSGSADDLARALTNLVTNAVRHTCSGGTVRLEASRTKAAEVLVAVIDECGGIPEGDLGRVFDAGWRGTPSRSKADGGAGLGLAIARAVVESHNGSISARNVPGGCRFDIALPA
ncbi:MAG: sensor histidine kinase [Propionibacteriaceae bacterium]|nr:sensor histidine kinase [Propionibacteriaceae bacterium]